MQPLLALNLYALDEETSIKAYQMALFSFKDLEYHLFWIKAKSDSYFINELTSTVQSYGFNLEDCKLLNFNIKESKLNLTNRILDIKIELSVGFKTTEPETFKLGQAEKAEMDSLRNTSLKSLKFSNRFTVNDRELPNFESSYFEAFSGAIFTYLALQKEFQTNLILGESNLTGTIDASRFHKTAFTSESSQNEYDLDTEMSVSDYLVLCYLVHLITLNHYTASDFVQINNRIVMLYINDQEPDIWWYTYPVSENVSKSNTFIGGQNE